MNRCLLIFGMATAVLACASMAYDQTSVTLDSVDGLYAPDTLKSGQKVTFYLRYTNNSGENMIGILNGYRVYSTDGAGWKTINIDTVGVSKRQFDLVLVTTYFDTLDHAGSDTVGVLGAVLDSVGLQNGYDQRAVSITVDLTDGRAIGKHICLDSSFVRPAGTWKWVGLSYNDYYPTWDGPHCYYVKDVPSDVEPGDAQLPASPLLSQNYPNPFNPTTIIRFSLPRAAHVTLTVYDILGREVKTLIDNVVGPGEHSIVWDSHDQTGSLAGSGVYYYRLKVGGTFESKKMVLVK